MVFAGFLQSQPGERQINIQVILWLAAGALSNQKENLPVRRERKNHATPSHWSGYANATYRRSVRVNSGLLKIKG